ncbi:MAG: sodium/proline symporter PutP [Bacteroidales bacterium]|nr:sodium/proline symporter PutP [Bacteroidales bacterium]MDD3961738.1 sodium/proline symporter PutP [Bacteroidales bacterium]MDY0285802.1 sodium/proline symporter PutP [Bacteroidales bacterium]
MNIPVIISFSVYILGMLAIGFYFYHKTNNISDYVLGGRGLNPVVTALSAGASDMSGWLLLGLPGLIYTTGLSGIWIAAGLITGAFLNWHYIAKRLRIFSAAFGDAITIPGYLAHRFSNHRLRIVSSLIILIFYTLYASAGLVGGAKLFEATFHLPYQTALITGTLIIVSYTFLGGYNAVSWTDFFQGIIMMLALVVVPVQVVTELGGLKETLHLVRVVNPDFLKLAHSGGIAAIISLAAWGLGYFGQPHILVRFMSIKKPERISSAKRIGMSWMVLSMAGSIAVGFFGIAFVHARGTALDDPEKIFILLSQLLFNPWIAGFVLAAILAAIMSTIDSQLLVSSSCLARDIYEKSIKKQASDKELVWAGRFTVLAIAGVAWLLSSDPESNVLSLVAYAWAGFGAAVGPVIILSLYSRKISATGALAGILTGATTVFVWKNLHGGVFDFYELLPAFVAGTLATLLFSRLFKPRSRITLPL